MSYILDALRRLDQDKERARRGTNPMEALLVRDPEKVEKPVRRRFWWLGMGFVLLATVIAATHWVTRRTLVLPTDHVQEASGPHLPSAQPQDHRTAPPSSAEEAPSFSQPRLPGRQDSVPSPSLSALSNPSQPSTASSEGQAEEVPPPSIPEPERLPTPAAEAPLPVASAEEDTLATRQDGGAMSREIPGGGALQEWRGTEIKINAIAYSRDRKNRFAVVNLKTLHEGDQIEGLSVEEIQEDGIVFEKEGTKYRVLLGSR